MLGHRKLEVGDYVSMLHRRRWLVAIPALLFPVLAVIVAAFLPAKYMSQTLVLVEEQKVPDEIVKPVVTSDLDARLASMKEQILSRSHVQPIVERYNLFGNSHMDMDDRIEAARKNIVITPIRSETGKTGLPGFFISFTAADARTAQLVCGEITSLFTNENLRSRQAAAEGTTDFLQSQLADAKRNLDDQDAKLAAFQSANRGSLPSEEMSNQTMLTTLNTQLQAATQDLERAQQDLSYQQSMLAQQTGTSTTGAPVAAVESSELLADSQKLTGLESQESDLLAHYTADYPDVIAVRRKISDLKKQIAKETAHPGTTTASIRHESPEIAQLRAQVHASEVGIAAKRSEQASIQSRLREYEGRIGSTPLVEEKYKDLTRDYDTAQKFYDSLLAQMNSAKEATELELRQQGEQFRVMDEPNLPDAPSFPNKVLFALGGLMMGLVVGLGIAAFLEYKDTSLRSEQDVWHFTRLPTLAVLPYSMDVAKDDDQPRFLRIRRMLGMNTSKTPQTEAGS
ncbi:MAG: Wzz/FepE/Etk N-terminal domain-containing protein [Acidobacteriota bacterium]